MPYVKGTFTGERARQVARSGQVKGTTLRPMAWWPEEVCVRIEKIVWKVYLLGDAGEDWHEFEAYDRHGRVLGVHRMDGY